MAYDYTPPDFLRNQSAAEIHRRMLDMLPNDIDKGELQIPWDLTRPAALVKSEFAGFDLNETVKLMFVLWAWGDWLDLHARSVGLSRRAANQASGVLLVRGKPGVVVDEGFQFATAAKVTASVIFEATETVVLFGVPDGQGMVTAQVPVRSVLGGRIGNVPPDTVILMVKPESGIVYITNPEAITGGTEKEEDDVLRERVLDLVRYGLSWTGCDADYVRWAMQVPGVGSALTEAEWAGPGTVRLFVVDANGAPANAQILDAVFEHIISPDDRMLRLAPIGASLTVVAPAPLYIDLEATVVLTEGETLSVVLERFKAGLDGYWLEASREFTVAEVLAGAGHNFVKYVFVGSTLARTVGISNYSEDSLLVNGSTADIVIPVGQFPVTRTVTLIEL